MKTFFCLIFSLLIISCSDTTRSEEKIHYGLPTSYPLKVGNAWAYKTTFFNPDSNRILLDTLYIAGRHGSSFQRSYHPEFGYDIVEGDSNKLIVLGHVFFRNTPDTTIYDKPLIWTFFNMDTGYVDMSEFEDYNFMADSIRITIEKDLEFMNNIYDVYAIEYYRNNPYHVWYDQLISVDGLMRERHYSNGEVSSEKLIQSMAENIFP